MFCVIESEIEHSQIDQAEPIYLRKHILTFEVDLVKKWVEFKLLEFELVNKLSWTWPGFEVAEFIAISEQLKKKIDLFLHC